MTRNTVITPSVIFAVAALGLSLPSLAAAQSAPNPMHARMLASACANCHGPDGVSQGVVPGLAGMPRDQLNRTMKEFKDGKRPTATIMHQIAKGYTDEQIDQIAGYFASVKAK
jgi:cytochrome subunit of sulfide dehydrogenase